jgi:hypothetical protein
MSDIVMNDVHDRQFIRHPSDIPLEYCFVDKPFCALDSINNVSLGGLSFQASQYIKPKQWLRLHIPINDAHFEIDAQVRWCNQRADKHYDVGVLFSTKDEAFTARMVEQVCHIEQYKKEVFLKEGRLLSGDEAAAEWIEKFANQFPQNPN